MVTPAPAASTAPTARTRPRAVLLDVDGTLVDTNFAHTVSWWEALRQHGHLVPMAEVHRAVGLGADKIVDHLIGPGDPDAQDERDDEAMRRVLDCDDVITAVTSSEDAEHSKPDTDILEVALQRAGVAASEAVFVGDAVWDMQASSALGLASIGMESGGTSAAELREAGADDVWSTPADLLEHWHDSLLSGRLAGQVRRRGSTCSP